MLLLFDVDGTLVDTGGAGRRALAAALEKVTGVPGALNGVRLNGSTDPTILNDAFEQHVGRARTAREETEILDTYLALLQEELRASDEYTVLPGAHELPKAARAAGTFAVGLATGNVQRGAELKLAHGGLWTHFRFGGYGSDAGDRTELVKRGIERGQQQAETEWGRRFKNDEVFVIGDTEKDIVAARAAGVQAVGVLEGSRHRDALIGSGPDLLVDSLLDPLLWKRLGLDSFLP